MWFLYFVIIVLHVLLTTSVIFKTLKVEQSVNSNDLSLIKQRHPSEIKALLSM